MSDDFEDIRIKLLVRKLKAFQGEGTSMITLLVPTGEQLSKSNKTLIEEFGTAKNIKSTTNRQSVLTAITTAQQKLKMFSKTPQNGLALFCGLGITPEGKEKKISICFEPPKPLTSSLYMCDNIFHTDVIENMTKKEKKYGFIIVDGNGALYSTLCGNNKTILQHYQVDLPKKHSKGGQSSVRFARLRIEARHNYITKVGEFATRWFIDHDRSNVDGLIIAGSADFKNKLNDSDMFDARLKTIVLSIVDIAYGGEAGFNQAVELCKDLLQNVRYVKERKVLTTFFTHISRDTNMYIFGKKETLSLLKQGVIEQLIIWDELKDKSEESDEKMEYESLVEWLVYNTKTYGTDLVTISDHTPEGKQFVTGFGGIGGILRYAIQNTIELDDELENVVEHTDFI